MGNQRRRGGGRGNPQSTIRGGGGPGLHSSLTLSLRRRGLQASAVYISSTSGTAQSRVRGRKGAGGFSALTTTPFPQSRTADNNRHNGRHTKAPSSYSPLPPGRRRQRCQRSDDHRSVARRSLALFPSLAGEKGEGTPRRPHLAQLLTVLRGRVHGRHAALPQLSLQLLQPLAQALQLRDAAASAATQPLLLGLFVRHLHTPLRRVRTWVT